MDSWILKISDDGHSNERCRSNLSRSNLNPAVALKLLREQLAVDKGGGVNLEGDHFQEQPGLVLLEEPPDHIDVDSAALYEDATLGLEHVEHLKSSYVRFDRALLYDVLGDRQVHMKFEALNEATDFRYFQSVLRLLLEPHHQYLGENTSKSLHKERHGTVLDLDTLSILHVKTPANILRFSRVRDQLVDDLVGVFANVLLDLLTLNVVSVLETRLVLEFLYLLQRIRERIPGANVEHV